MEERKYQRFYFEGDLRGEFVCGSSKESGRLIDIGAGGMRIHFFNPVSPGTHVHSQLQIASSQFRPVVPFYVRGKVIRVHETAGIWDVAVQFDAADPHMFEGLFE